MCLAHLRTSKKQSFHKKLHPADNDRQSKGQDTRAECQDLGNQVVEDPARAKEALMCWDIRI